MKIHYISNLIKKRQNLLRLAIGTIIIALILSVVSLALKKRQIKIIEAKSTYTVGLDKPIDNKDIETVWRADIENKQLTVENEFYELKQELLSLKEKYKEELEKREEQTKFFNQEIKKIEENYQEKLIGNENLKPIPLDNEGNIITPQIKKFGIKLVNEKSGIADEVVKTIDNTIPAGSSAKEKIVGGVAASTSLSSQADPRPVLLRIIDRAILPNKFRGDLVDCHVTASGYGDLSSERVYMRTEKMSCVNKKTGEIIETAIAGYVAGEDSEAGVRGKVVSKEYQFLEHSLMGGVLSGLGKTITPQSVLINPFTANGKIQSPPLDQRLTNNLSEGAANSLERYAQYHIDKAENIQPIIEVAAGRNVDIVFTEAALIGSKNVHETISEVRNKARNKANNLNKGVSNE